MYTEGDIRPPSPKEMQEKYLPLEILEFMWYDDEHFAVVHGYRKVGEMNVITDPAEPTMAELVDFVIQNDIPLSAKLVYDECGSHRMALDWKED